MLVSITPLLAILAVQAPPAPDYWGELRPGPHAVGFTQHWVLDSTRVLPDGGTYGLRFRPILMNLWYPAEPGTAAAMMPYSDLFDGAVRAAAPELASYAAELVEFERTIAWRELAKASPDSTSPELRTRIERLLEGSTAAIRDAAYQPGPWPVVVYTQGSQSSMDDNLVLCEFLASHGFLVVGSAYPEEDNTSFATNASDQSRQRDIRRLIWELSRTLGYAPDRVIGVGHSAGAQALQLFAADPSATITGLVSLDTTEDYATLSDRAWAYYTDKVVARRKHIELPMLVVAGPEALFELADSLVSSDRVLATVPYLGHNDFISQGVIRRQLLEGLPEAEADAESEAETDAFVGGAYAALAECVRQWITGGDGACPFPVKTQHVPPGESAPTIASGLPQSAREVRHLFSTSEPDAFAAIAAELRPHHEEIASDGVLMMLLAGAVRTGEVERARAMYHALVRHDPTTQRILEVIKSRAILFDRIGARDEGAVWRRIAEAIG